MPLDDGKIIDMLVDLQRGLGRVEGKLDSHIMTVATHMAVTAAALTSQDVKNESQDKAIRKLEVNQGKYAGAATILGAAFGWISYHLWPFVNKF